MPIWATFRVVFNISLRGLISGLFRVPKQIKIQVFSHFLKNIPLVLQHSYFTCSFWVSFRCISMMCPKHPISGPRVQDAVKLVKPSVLLFNCAFYLVFMVATTNLSFYFSHFGCLAIWHLQNWFNFRHHLLIFLILAVFWLSETGQICDFWTFSWEHMGEMAWNFGMPMYPDHFQNWLDFGHGLLIFFILASFWLSETGQIWGF